MLEVRVQDGEVGGEHAGCDLVAVGAIADESVDEAGGFGGLGVAQCQRRSLGWEVLRGLTKASCTAPQKQVAVASVSVDQPSFARPARGKVFGGNVGAAIAISECSKLW